MPSQFAIDCVLEETDCNDLQKLYLQYMDKRPYNVLLKHDQGKRLDETGGLYGVINNIGGLYLGSTVPP